MANFSNLSGSQVYWREKGKQFTGKICEIYYVTVMTQINGQKIVRTGTRNNPALLIQMQFNQKRLKLLSELESVPVTEDSISD